jgi:thiol-disulfide isomerase/thioredoxin
MKQYQQTIFIALVVLVMIAWMGRSYIRGWFPSSMKFKEMALTTIDSNQLISIADFKGKVVIVSCYQTWCIDCARETPVLNQLATQINSNQFKVIYVSNEDAEKVNKFRQRFESGNILFTQSPKSMSDLGIRSFPTTYLLNKKGEMIKTTFEGYQWLKEEVTIEKLIAQ